MTFHVASILACTTCLVRALPPSLYALRPLFPLLPRGRSPKTFGHGPRMYAEQISLDELPTNTPAPLVQFDSIPPLLFSFLFLTLSIHLSIYLFSFFSRSFSFTRSISDLHDPVTPPRTIDPRLTLLGVVSLNSICFFFLLSSASTTKGSLRSTSLPPSISFSYNANSPRNYDTTISSSYRSFSNVRISVFFQPIYELKRRQGFINKFPEISLPFN